ncbi:MAG: NAD(P)/FAD-dependent oxidoreductase [Gammaproteobacteria bacterium]|jgi:monoamine oxidase|nr:NAD(P)/FAD-dependent oxidoreductase [Gammaproteobacteria bacterium]
MRNFNLPRRQFVLGSLAGAAGLAARGAGAAGEQRDVMVLGAGLAGLYATMVLRDTGLNVLLLEASARPGGRVHTVETVDGQIEMGASQVGPGYARVRDVARKLDLPLAPGAHLYAPYAFVVDNQLSSAADWPDSPANKLRGAERERLPHTLRAMYLEERSPFTTIDGWLQPDAAQYDVSLFEWLRREGASDEAIRLIDSGLVDPGVLGVSTLTLLQESGRSMLEMKKLLEQPGSENMDVYQLFGQASSHFEGGMKRLPFGMAAALGDHVRFGMPVAAIDMDATGVDVRCSGGERFRAKAVISAMPFTTLRRVAINPAPPGAQGLAIKTMPYGRQSQVWLRVKKEPYWEVDGLDASMWSNGDITLMRQEFGYDGSRELVSALAIGRHATALDNLAPADRGQFVLDYMARIRPSTQGRLEVVLAQSWQQEPYVAGVRHSYAPGQAARFMHAMIAPHQRLHFAGEHTRRLEVGMESAMESGERAALEVLERLAG